MHSDEKTRFSRQLSISGWSEERQEKLSHSRVFVAGCGGLGSPVILYLTAAGIGTLHLADFDDVELSNLNRQIIHSTESIGLPKVISASSTAERLNPHLKTIMERSEITVRNCASLIEGADIIMDCLDNFQTRHILNEAAVKASIPVVHGGIEEFRGQVSFIQTPETPCMSCFLPHKDKNEKPQVAGPTAGIIGSLQAMEAVRYLAGFAPALKSRLLFFDGTTMETEIMKLVPNPKCPVCKSMH